MQEKLKDIGQALEEDVAEVRVGRHVDDLLEEPSEERGHLAKHRERRLLGYSDYTVQRA